MGIGKIVLVSTCGWWELDNFGRIVRISREIAQNAGVEFVGALLRPHLPFVKGNEEAARGILEASKKAGYQLVKDGRMSAEVPGR